MNLSELDFLQYSTFFILTVCECETIGTLPFILVFSDI